MKGLPPKMKLGAVNDGDAPSRHVTVPCTREELKPLRIGRKVTVTIEGSIDDLMASPEDLTGETEDNSTLGLTVLGYKIRGGGPQEEGIYLLAEDEDE